LFFRFYPENFLGSNLIELIGFLPLFLESTPFFYFNSPHFLSDFLLDCLLDFLLDFLSDFLFRILFSSLVACNDHSQRRYTTAGNSF